MHDITTKLGALAAVALLAAGAHATVTIDPNLGLSIGSASSAQATADVGSRSSVMTSDGGQPATTNALPVGPYSITSQTTASDADGVAGPRADAAATNTTTVTFASAASGVATFMGIATAATDADDGYAYAASGYYVQYGFATDADDMFTIDYALSGPTLGCCGNAIQLQDYTVGGSLLYHTLYDQDLSGTLTAALEAGHSYRLTITKGEYPYTDAPAQRGPGGQTYTHDDRFAFRIGAAAADPVSDVPEPATWATMVAGFGLVGAAMRGRRVGAPLAA